MALARGFHVWVSRLRGVERESAPGLGKWECSDHIPARVEEHFQGEAYREYVSAGQGGFHQVQDRGSGRWCPAHHDGGPGRYRPAAVNGVVAVAQTVGGSCRLLGN